MAKDLKQLLAEGLIARGGRSHTPTHTDTHQAPNSHRYRPTGIPGIDAVLPGGGLRCGAVHECFGWPTPTSSTSTAFPPLSILISLALSPGEDAGEKPGLIIWIGQRLWPSPLVLPPAALRRSLFIDPADEGGKGGAGVRLWAIDQALRSTAVSVVIADGSGLDMAATRRLQLAAESVVQQEGEGNQQRPIGLLARPPRDRGLISAAESRWQVTPHHPLPPHPSHPHPTRPRWRLELLRCRGAALDESHAWIVEQGEDHAPALRASADVADQSTPAKTATRSTA